jgi:cell division transport system permease protein
MIWNSLDFVFHEAALQLKRERLIAIATISTVAVLMLLVGAIVLFLLDLHLSAGWTLGEVDVWACFDSDLSREQAIAEAAKIGAWPEVRSHLFVSKEEGLEWLHRKVASSAALKELGNPLPDGVRVWVKEPRFLAPVAQRIEQMASIDSVRRSDDFFQRVVRLKRGISWAFVIVSVLVSVAGVFIVHNTVRLSLHARWREIYIMQLVGATRAITASPFLLEGAVHGALGSALAACILAPLHMYFVSATEGLWAVSLVPDRAMPYFALCLVVAGASLGIAGSALSIRRHLRHGREWQP